MCYPDTTPRRENQWQLHSQLQGIYTLPPMQVRAAGMMSLCVCVLQAHEEAGTRLAEEKSTSSHLSSRLQDSMADADKLRSTIADLQQQVAVHGTPLCC